MNKMMLSLTAVCFVLCAVAVDGHVCLNKQLDSNDFAYLRISLDDALAVTSMTVTQHLSQSPCTLDQSYGFLGPYVWVHRGCRAKFDICYDEGLSNKVTCSSLDYKSATCTSGLNNPQGIYLDTHHSDSPCIQNFSYRIQDNQVWVDKGCRAKFHVVGSNA